jgi:hypothetical protein
MRCNKEHHHSITSSARASSVGDTVNPNAFAVFRLITSSNFVVRQSADWLGGRREE